MALKLTISKTPGNASFAVRPEDGEIVFNVDVPEPMLLKLVTCISEMLEEHRQEAARE